MKDQVEIAIARIESGLDRAGRNSQNLELLMDNLRAELDKRVGPRNEWSDEYRLHLTDLHCSALEACLENAVRSEEYEQAAVLKRELDRMRVAEKKLEKKLEKVL